MTVVNLKTSEVGCRKPGCKRRMEMTHRHHRRCETIFVRGFDHDPVVRKSKRYRRFCKRYESFNHRDIVVICAWHHCEVHLGYDAVILQDKARRGKLLSFYDWNEATSLMSKLRNICLKWEKEETPGIDPAECTPSKRFSQAKPKKHKRKEKKVKK